MAKPQAKQQPQPLPLALILGSVGGGLAALGLAAALLLRRKGRGKDAAAGKDGKGSTGPGPWAKLKPTAQCVALADGSACVVRREIAADNSCLFNSVGYVMHKSKIRAPHLRNVVAQQVSGDRATYSDAFLGMTNEAYCNWIRQPFNWGGGIELSILAQAYGMEIAAWNIESRKSHVFGEESGYKRQVMVIYTGTHYDALAICAGPRANPENDETDFNPRTKRGKLILAAAQKLVDLAHKASPFNTGAATSSKAAAANGSASQGTSSKAKAGAASDARDKASASSSAPSPSSSSAGTKSRVSRVGRSAAGAGGSKGTSSSGTPAAAAAGNGQAAGGQAGEHGGGAGAAALRKLRCGDCGVACEGGAAAAAHAAATGHANFEEVA